jgi:hypothetical protein
MSISENELKLKTAKNTCHFAENEFKHRTAKNTCHSVKMSSNIEQLKIHVIR